jgi:hypothetical protein
MAKNKITSDDYSTIVLGMNALINELNAKNVNGNFNVTIENATEIADYLQAKIDKRENLGIGWYTKA